MRRVGIVLMFAVLIMFASNISATIINVPADQPNIQAGINASSDGDTVRVESGTYVENINFSGKNIVVGSWFLDAGDTSFISSTIIDGGASGSVVTFENGEDNSAVITGFTIQNGAGYGGGICCRQNSNPTISNNIISGNSTQVGGGIGCWENSNPTITDNNITENSASSVGGGIACSYHSSPTISNNTISGNSAVHLGGGISCDFYSSPTISNNTISGNSALQYDGGGIFCSYSIPTISSNTITGNSAIVNGGGIYCWDSSPPITNTIFWGNSAPTEPEICLYLSSPVITYCDIQGGWPGEGNIDCNPLFCYPDTGNFYLAENSCCVGSGEGGADIGALGVGCEAIWGYIAGTVTDEESQPLEGVYVVAGGTSIDDSTDVNGEYLLDSLDVGIYDVSFSHHYYIDTIVTDISVTPGDTTTLDLAMQFAGYPYLPGDVNMAYGNWPPMVMPDDWFYFINGGPACLLDGFWASVDINGDCSILYGDIVALLGYIVAGGSLSYCPDYEPMWPTPDELPDDPPPDWPPCEAPPLEPPEDDVFIWFGNLDESPIIANINDRVYVDVYIQTPNSAYIADMHIPVGIEDQYIDDFLTADHQYFYPLTDWAYIITYQFGSPPNPTGWSSQSILAFCYPNNDPWLHFETPQLIMKIAVQTVNNPELAGNTVQCIGIGSHPDGWPFCVGDTLGIFDYPITEYISPVFFNYPYLPGDVNMALGIWPPQCIGGDVTYLVGYFIGGGQESCLLNGFWASADINGDCLIIGGDVTALVGYFISGGSLVPCPDYEPVWPPFPDEAPDGWPNCDAPVINSRVIPTGQGK